jgi:hypothetical protein
MWARSRYLGVIQKSKKKEQRELLVLSKKGVI